MIIDAVVARIESSEKQRRLEGTLSVANHEQLKLQCRLEETMEQVEAATTARDKAPKASARVIIGEDDEIEALTEKLRRSESMRERVSKSGGETSASVDELCVALT